MSGAPPTVPTYAEYLEMEARSEERHEYVAGEIFAMSGASIAHNRIVGRLFVALTQALDGTPCEPFISTQRVRVDAADAALYPDITVVCGGIETSSSDAQGLVNPTALFEVLSPTTESWDRGGKFERLRQLRSLKTYVLVSQEKRLIERYTRNDDDSWRLVECRHTLELPNLGIAIDFQAIYGDVA